MKSRLPAEYQNSGANMNQMVRKAQKMQEDIEVVQKQLEETDFTTTAGGGMIELTNADFLNALSDEIEKKLK